MPPNSDRSPPLGTPSVGSIRRNPAYCRVRGFSDAWEACIQEQDPHRDHWNHKAHGFEHLCAKIKQGDWVVVLDKSWPPLAPAYAQVNGQWQLTRHIWGPRLRQRLEHQVQTIQRQQREQETLQSRNRPATPEVVESGNGPGSRTATLGPHVDSEETVTKQNVFKSQDEAAKSISQQILPTSIAEDVEYGGMIYQNGDGTYGYTGPIKGEEGSVNPGGPKSVPKGTTPVAYWHTHGADNPDYESETFSKYYDSENKAWVGDIPYAKHYKIDAYVATPSGKLRYYSVKDDKEVLIGNLKPSK